MKKTSYALSNLKWSYFQEVIFQDILNHTVMYPEIFWGYCFCFKSFILVSWEAPPSLMLGEEGQKIFEFNTSTLLKKALRHFPAILSLSKPFFLLFIFWAPEFGHQYCIHSIQILLDISLLYRFINLLTFNCRTYFSKNKHN